MKAGQQVYVLCARVDHWGLGESPEESEIAIDRASLSWLRVTVVSVEPDDEGEAGATVRYEDGATTWWAMRFLSETAPAVVAVAP